VSATETASLKRIQSALRNLPDHWRWGLGSFLVYRVLLTLWGLALWRLGLIHSSPESPYYYGLSPITGSLAGPLVGIWQRWDAIHYTRIATGGYSAPELSGFHPLFPLLGGFVSRALGLEPLTALLLVANLALAGALVLLYRLVASEFGGHTARRTLVALLVFPGAYFLAAPYAESLTLLLVVAAWLCARKSRWLIAFVMGTLAGLSHSTGLLLAVPLVVEAIKQTRGNPALRRFAVIGVALGPIAGTGVFLAWRAAQGFAPWLVTRRELWGASIEWPWVQLLSIGEVFRSPYFVLTGWASLLVLSLALIASWWWIRHPHAAWTAWQLAMVVFLLSVHVTPTPLASWLRHLMVLPALFVALPNFIQGSWPRRIGLAAGVAIQLYLSALHMMWIWVT
jgi:hypothetical protein